jgi:hypothetical protein
MNDIILLGKWIFSQSFNVMRSEIPLFLVRDVLSSNKTFIVSNRKKNAIFTFSFTIVYSWLVLQLYFVLVIVVTHSFANGRVIMMLSYHFFLLFDSIVDVSHQKP